LPSTVDGSTSGARMNDPRPRESAETQKRIGSFRRLLLFAGLFNVSLAFPLAVPPLLGPYLGALSALNVALGLGGEALQIPAPGAPAMLANTAGIDLVLIGSLVLYAARDPERRRFIVLANAAGRLVFALLVAYYVLVLDVAKIVLIIGGIDVALGVGFLYFLRHTASSTAAPT
jgi:hypothetical protein